jgi:hypothetical protein
LCFKKKIVTIKDLVRVAMFGMGILEISAAQPRPADLQHRMEGGQEFKINQYKFKDVICSPLLCTILREGRLRPVGGRAPWPFVHPDQTPNPAPPPYARSHIATMLSSLNVTRNLRAIDVPDGSCFHVFFLK